MSQALLAGVRVVEFAALTSGDYLGMLLADMGADVIKVESPDRGDYVRDILGQIAPHRSPSHEQFNRNKRSVALDLRTDEGRADFWALLKSADVFIDGFTAGTTDRLGIGYQEQRLRHDSIIYCQVSGFGATEPYASIPTHGRMMNALAGGKPHDMGGDGYLYAADDPTPMGGTTVSGQGAVLVGLYATQFVLAALLRRSREGIGCYIDVSGADAVIAASPQGAVHAWNDHLLSDRSTMPVKVDGETGSATYQYYETSDEQVVLFGAIERKFWQRFCAAIDRADLQDAVGGQHVDFAGGDVVLRKTLQDVFRERSLTEWMSIAAAHQIPIAPAYRSVGDALDDPQFRNREIIARADLGGGLGEFVYVGRPAVIDNAPFTIDRIAPALGQHTEEVIAELRDGSGKDRPDE